MAKNHTISRALHANLNLECYRVKDASTYFGIVHKAGSIMLDETSFTLYLLLIDVFPYDTLTLVSNKNGLSVIGGSNIIENTMMKPYYASNANNPDINHIVDTAYQLYSVSGMLTGDEITDHIDDRIGNPKWNNAHNIDTKADLYGNELINFNVADSKNAHNAVSHQQFISIKDNDGAIPRNGDFFLKGFFDDIAIMFPADDLSSTKKGWYWIITTAGTDGSNTDWFEGDAIVYNGIGNGSDKLSWTRVPAPIINGGTF